MNLTFEENFAVVKNGHLALHDLDLVDLCSEYGTPLFAFDEDRLVANFERIRRAFDSVYSKVIVCYSVKTNNNLTICKTLREKNAYAEVSSELDFDTALEAGFAGDHIIFDGTFKPKEALQKALEAKVLLINVESFTEMERLNNVAGEMGVRQPIGLRINPFEDPGFHKYTSASGLIDSALCHPSSRFGFSLNDTYLAFKKAKKFENLSVEGIMTHPYHTATKYLLPIMHEIQEKLGVEIKYLNIGGGFDPGVTRSVGIGFLIIEFIRRKMGRKSRLAVERRATKVESIAKQIVEEIKQGLGGLSEPTIVVEPGKFVTASSGILLVRVDHLKEAGGYKWAIVDGGTNIVPNFLGGKELRKVIVANKASSEPEETINVVGPLLYPEDLVAFQVKLPKVSEGDILSILACGAYTLSMSNQFLYPRPAAVLLNSKGEVKVIREKETFEDFSHKDTI